MKNTKRLINLDRIVFGVMCGLAIFSKRSTVAFIGVAVLAGYFISSLLHTPEYFE